MSQAKASSIDCVAELEDFLKQSGVEDEMKAMLKSMFEAKPSNAITWMIRYLIARAGPTSDSNVSIASGSDVMVCVSSTTLVKQETVNDSKLAPIFQRLACSVVSESPKDNILSFVTTAAHNLQKENPSDLK